MTYPAAAGGDHRAQLAHLKAHLAFQNQDKCQLARVDWCTTITRAQSRQHLTRELHRKINAKVPGFHGTGKLDSPEGQEALRTAARHVAMRNHHGGNGFFLIGWNLRHRMYRERSRRRGLPEYAFWEIMAEVRNSPRLRPKEDEFPEYIRYRHALRRRTAELTRAQGANPRHHRDAFILATHLCPLTGEHISAADADDDGHCPHCALRLDGFTLTERAFDPADPPALIAPGTWRKQPGRTARPQRVPAP